MLNWQVIWPRPLPTFLFSSMPVAVFFKPINHSKKNRRCFSGGLILFVDLPIEHVTSSELTQSVAHIIGTSTCTQKGYGYDAGGSHSGAWTDMFLSRGLRLHTNEDVDLVVLYNR